MKQLFTLLFGFTPFLLLAQVNPDLAAALQARLDAELVSNDAVGYGAAVILPDGSRWEGVSGVSTIGVDLTTEYTFGIGSITKSFTAAVLTELEEEGTLSLDDPISMYLDSIPNINMDATIRQCLNHTAGNYDYRANPDLFTSGLTDSRKVWEPVELIETFVNAPNFAPGASWSYSNTNYVLAGMVIKSVTGNEYYDEYKKRFFDPLDLLAANAAPFQMKVNPLANLWFDVLGTGVIDINLLSISTDGLFSIGGAAGGIVATPAETAKWMRSLVKAEATSQVVIDEMLATTPPLTYGLGIYEESFQGMTRIGHGGNIIYASEAFHIPDLDITIAVCTNDGSKPLMTPIYTAMMEAYQEFLNPSSTNDFSLSGNVVAFPNPFDESLNLEIDLAKAEKVQVQLMDTYGKPIKILLDESLPFGKSRKAFNLENQLAAGTYLIRVQTESGSTFKKVIKY